MVKGKHYVPAHKWKPGKTGRHPGYWRKTRGKGRRRIKARPIYARIDTYKDEYGQLKPERKWTIIKRRNV